MADSYIRTKQEETQFSQLLQAIRSGGGGGGSTVEVQPTQTDGNEVGRILVDGLEAILYSKKPLEVEKIDKWTVVKFDNNFCIMLYIDRNCWVGSWNWWGNVVEAFTGVSNLVFPYEFDELPIVKVAYPTLNALSDEFTYTTTSLGSAYAVRGSTGQTGDTTAVLVAIGFLKGDE